MQLASSTRKRKRMPFDIGFSSKSRVLVKERGKVESIVRKAVEEVFSLFKFSENVSFSFVSSAEIRELNKSYRKIDRATDVLTFCYEEGKYKDGERKDSFKEEKKLGESELFAEVFFSLKAIRDNTRENKEEFDVELFRVSLHSALHILGFEHEEGKSIVRLLEEGSKMIEIQEDLVNNYKNKKI